ncbi:cation:proton antiporter [Notoacmeibacter sp. MSK16QG-6]|uniref:cation:proton antiporter n=1 Tax=Notoacmeibacter sp. MSK16QG-6 TaxID=2957982 RepID=UPI0020A21D8F|nr:cation:proton antiporter [Notoacmeibacter sp. MSK16QG-6]MCP1199724.1 cation:proton antiporter [Notoacmeibacter sp. MSK16QG-6]
MDEHHTAFPLIDVAMVIAVATVLGLGLMRMRQPPLVGFILAGMLMGPTALGFIRTSESVNALAEMGVLVLLFFIGLEISLKAFVLSLRPAVLIASGQLIAGLLVGFLIAWAGEATTAEGVVLGFIIALSSTVVAMKMLDDMGELRGDSGRIAIAILIAQDIAVVPMLIIVGALGRGEASILLLIVKVLAAVTVLAVVLWYLGKRGKLRFPFTSAVEGNVEMLALGALAICFGGAAASGYSGLSPAYGAFLAGLLLGNSTLRARVIPVIEPIQSVLLVVFFLSIGLLIDLNYIWSNLALVVGTSLAVIAAKSLLNIQLLAMTGHSRETALIAGLSTAQIGEFSFVLATTGLSAGALGYDFYRLAIAVTAVTLLVSPAWTFLMHRVEDIATEGYWNYREGLQLFLAEERARQGRRFYGMKVRWRAGRYAIRKRQRSWREARELKRQARTSQPSHHFDPKDHA